MIVPFLESTRNPGFLFAVLNSADHFGGALYFRLRSVVTSEVALGALFV
jgi:hypothetical protein